MKICNLLIMYMIIPVIAIIVLFAQPALANRFNSNYDNSRDLPIIVGDDVDVLNLNGNEYSGPVFGPNDCSYFRYDHSDKPILIQRTCPYNNDIINSNPVYHGFPR